jgi:exopolyphosphatase / guanosine-5'-triphosphate,3'-diphosphate pyrophosphatase
MATIDGAAGMREPEVFAAVDLGSNSFRMEVGRVVGSQIYTIDALREPVRLASGLTKDKVLDRDASARGLATLERFGERLRGFDQRQVRAVATNTLRVARNAKEFLRQGEAKLGFPIEVIAGREEARLIYYGVAHLLEPGPSRRFVVDIGGGSTELIVGTGYTPEILESVYIGCVGASLKYFPGDQYDKSAFNKAELAARQLLEPIAKPIRKAGWIEAIGSSGTARALHDLIEQNGFAARGITVEGLDRLRAAMIRAGSSEHLKLVGLKPDRVPVLAGGLAIMSAVFAEFAIERMSVSDGALRTGVLYDLLGRASREDMREATVREFMQRYKVDEAHAQAVASLARELWTGLVTSRVTPETPLVDGAESAARLLQWAGLLHEIGLSISHNGYHKHAAYILSNADMPGFSKREQATLAALALGHTGKLPKMKDLIEAEDDWRLVLCLRLAATIYRSRNYDARPLVALKADRKQYTLHAPAAWLEANPLTEFDLRTEVEEWRRLGKSLELVAD